MTIERDQCDFDKIDDEYGPLAETATFEQQAKHYRLAQAAKIIRQSEEDHD
jgi:hypothetical protein